jgi:preprotein translocase subunit SecD
MQNEAPQLTDMTEDLNRATSASHASHHPNGGTAMTRFRNALAGLLLSLLATGASAETVAMQGHKLQISAVDQPNVAWITQDDVKTVERTTNVQHGRPALYVTLKPDAAQRMLALTSANIGKQIRFTWDGTVVADGLVIKTGFGSPFELPAPASKP